MTGVLRANTSLPGSRATQQAYGQRMLFTGPDCIGDYRARLNNCPRYIGVGPSSPEGTSDLNYLYRAAPCTPPPMPKQCYIGGVGWGVQYCGVLNSRTLLSDKQIKLGEFRSALEDRVTHRYQNPWHAPPHFLDRQPTGARGRLAWTHNTYDNYCQDSNKEFLLTKQQRQATWRKGGDAFQVSSVSFPEIVRVNTGH